MYTANDFAWQNTGPLDMGFGAPSLSTGQYNVPSMDTGSMPGSVGGLSGLQIGGLALGGLQALGNLWGMFQANKLAKKQFKYTKQVTDTNLANSIQSYNTTLEDRIRARSFTEGRDAGYADSYLKTHALPEYKRPPQN